MRTQVTNKHFPSLAQQPHTTATHSTTHYMPLRRGVWVIMTFKHQGQHCLQSTKCQGVRAFQHLLFNRLFIMNIYKRETNRALKGQPLCLCASDLLNLEKRSSCLRSFSPGCWTRIGMLFRLVLQGNSTWWQQTFN